MDLAEFARLLFSPMDCLQGNSFLQLVTLCPADVPSADTLAANKRIAQF